MILIKISWFSLNLTETIKQLFRAHHDSTISSMVTVNDSSIFSLKILLDYLQVMLNIFENSDQSILNDDSIPQSVDKHHYQNHKLHCKRCCMEYDKIC